MRVRNNEGIQNDNPFKLAIDAVNNELNKIPSSYREFLSAKKWRDNGWL